MTPDFTVWGFLYFLGSGIKFYLILFHLMGPGSYWFYRFSGSESKKVQAAQMAATTTRLFMAAGRP